MGRPGDAEKQAIGAQYAAGLPKTPQQQAGDVNKKLDAGREFWGKYGNTVTGSLEGFGAGALANFLTGGSLTNSLRTGLFGALAGGGLSYFMKNNPDFFKKTLGLSDETLGKLGLNYEQAGHVANLGIGALAGLVGRRQRPLRGH